MTSAFLLSARARGRPEHAGGAGAERGFFLRGCGMGLLRGVEARGPRRRELAIGSWFEGLDKTHATDLAFGTDLAEFLCRGVRMGFGGRVEDLVLLGVSEQRPAQGELLSAQAVGQEAEVADALESLGQSMQEKPTNELHGVEPHGALAIS